MSTSLHKQVQQVIIDSLFLSSRLRKSESGRICHVKMTDEVHIRIKDAVETLQAGALQQFITARTVSSEVDPCVLIFFLSESLVG